MHPGPTLPLGLTGHIGVESFPLLNFDSQSTPGKLLIPSPLHAYLVSAGWLCGGAVNTITTPSDGLGKRSRGQQTSGEGHASHCREQELGV